MKAGLPPITLWQWLLAALPVVVLATLVLWGRLKTAVNALITVGVAVVVSAISFGGGADVIGVGLGKGVWTGVWILYVVWTALLLYQLARRAGLAGLGDAFSSILPRSVENVLVVAWVFPTFVQGVAGFGTPIAVSAPLLVSMGYGPVQAVALPLIGYNWSVTFGSMGSSFYMGAFTAGLANGDVHHYATAAALLLGLNAIVSGVLVCLMHGGLRSLRDGARMIAVVGPLMAAGMLFAVQVEPSIGGLAAGAAGFLGVGVLRFLGRSRRAQTGEARDGFAAVVDGTQPAGWRPASRDGTAAAQVAGPAAGSRATAVAGAARAGEAGADPPGSDPPGSDPPGSGPGGADPQDTGPGGAGPGRAETAASGASAAGTGPTMPASAGGGAGAAGEGSAPGRRALLILMPYVYLLVVVLAVLVPPAPRAWVKAHVLLGPSFAATRTAHGLTNPAVQHYTPIALFSHPGTYILLAALLGWLTYLVAGLWPRGELGATLRDWRRQAWAASPSIVALAAVATVMVDSGMVRTIAVGAAEATGHAYPAVAGLIGALGSFTTGSTTSSNALFSALQRDVATLIGAQPADLLAAQTSGGNVGNSLAPVVILIGLSAIGARDRVGETLRSTLLPAAVLLAVVAAGTMLLVARS